MGISVRPHADTGQFGELALEIESLCRELTRAAECADVQLGDYPAERRQSLENLHAYLALRARDLRPLQNALARWGLASLSHTEPHVLATLNAVRVNTNLLFGQSAPPADTHGAFDSGPALLAGNATRLLGPARGHRRARIMITLPDAAAEDPLLLQALLRDGMDCARINCAYGDQAEWSRTIGQLRAAQEAAGRPCQLFMDLRGPKLRTGRMQLERAVLKIRPLRAPDGRVLRPARIRLTSRTGAPLEPGAAEGCLVLDHEWLQQAAPGDRIRLQDARGASRNWTISARDTTGCWAESRKTTYLVNGTGLRLQHARGRDAIVTTLTSLPQRESRVAIRPGDILFLTRDDEPGTPAVIDPAGALLRPGRIPLPVDAVFRDARVGEPICFDDGRIGGVIEQADGELLQIRIRHTRRPLERLSGDKGVNLPETALDLPALGDEDLRDLDFVSRHADIIGLSFTNTAADVRSLHQHLRTLGRTDVGVIFKLETRRGCAALPGILLEAMRLPNCGIMIARGDLAAEVGFEHLAALQDDILRVCEAAHAPVVWATGVLEDLARGGHPARAEITDAAMAQRAECVMLGKGRHVLRALQTLDYILSRMQDREHKHQARLGELASA